MTESEPGRESGTTTGGIKGGTGVTAVLERILKKNEREVEQGQQEITRMGQ